MTPAPQQERNNQGEIIGREPSQTFERVAEYKADSASVRPTNELEDVIERHCGPGEFLATIYHYLAIDASKDFNGRPAPIVDHGKPIPELIRA